jgi:hypothetical protein
MLIVIILNVVVLSVIMVNIIVFYHFSECYCALSVFMLGAAMLSDCANCQSIKVLIIRLTVVAPQKKVGKHFISIFSC